MTKPTVRQHVFLGISEQCSRCGAWRPGGWANAPKTPCLEAAR